MFVLLLQGNPGRLQSGECTTTNRRLRDDTTAALPNGTAILYDQVSGRPVDEGRQLYDKTGEITVAVDEAMEMDASLVKWVDSRPIRGGDSDLHYVFVWLFVF